MFQSLCPKINDAVSLVSISTLQAFRLQGYDMPAFHFHKLMQSVRMKFPLVNVKCRRKARESKVKKTEEDTVNYDQFISLNQHS